MPEINSCPLQSFPGHFNMTLHSFFGRYTERWVWQGTQNDRGYLETRSHKCCTSEVFSSESLPTSPWLEAWGIQRLAWEGRTTSGQCCQSTSLLFWFVDCVRGALVTNRPLRYSLQNVGNGRWAGLHGELFAAEGSDWLEHAFWGWWLCSMVVEEGRKLDLQYFIQSFRSFNHFLTKRHAQNEPVWMFLVTFRLSR